ncbi:ninjurin-A-like [Ochlerotatus camptorhynchus]|uniref:ninjurin-A-like n=1 Tax=Ochlerotatus camptorhynchus TaxID=644619 RepID=UPI0031DBEB87
MSNTNETDKYVEIVIEEAAGNSIGNETDTKPTATVVPVVPEVVNLPKEEARPPKSNSSGTRGRQLKPDSNGTRSRSGSRSPNRRTRRDTDAAQNDAVPLLPVDEGRLPRQKPPLAGPEMDVDDRPSNGPNDNRGIDDGFLPEKPTRDDRDRDVDRRKPGRRDSYPPFPYAPEYGPQLPPVIQTADGARIIPDVNVYQQKKNLAQGMMDLALLSANANQLRYVLESYSRHPYFYFSLVFISTSIICQVAVGIGLIWKSRYNIKNEDDFCKADRINNMITIGIFLITLVNVLISAFGVAEPTQSV